MIEQFQNSIDMLLEIYGSNQETKAKLSIVNLTISQSNNISAIIKNDTVNEISILHFSGYWLQTTKVFHQSFLDPDNIQNNVFDSQYILYATNKLNITRIKFITDNITYDFNTDSKLDTTKMYIKFCSRISNYSGSGIMTSTVNGYNDTIYSEYNNFDVNNDNSTLVLSIINNICHSVVSNEIFGTDITSPKTANKIHFHDVIFKDKLLDCEKENLFNTINILNTNLGNSYLLIVTHGYFMSEHINVLISSFSNNDRNGINDESIWDNYHINDNNVDVNIGICVSIINNHIFFLLFIQNECGE